MAPETIPEDMKASDLLDKDFKTTELNMLKKLKQQQQQREELKEIRTMIYDQNKNINKEKL